MRASLGEFAYVPSGSLLGGLSWETAIWGLPMTRAHGGLCSRPCSATKDYAALLGLPNKPLTRALVESADNRHYVNLSKVTLIRVYRASYMRIPYMRCSGGLFYMRI